jgi:hypothetical protein
MVFMLLKCRLYFAAYKYKQVLKSRDKIVSSVKINTHQRNKTFILIFDLIDYGI